MKSYFFPIDVKHTVINLNFLILMQTMWQLTIHLNEYIDVLTLKIYISVRLSNFFCLVEEYGNRKERRIQNFSKIERWNKRQNHNMPASIHPSGNLPSIPKWILRISSIVLDVMVMFLFFFICLHFLILWKSIRYWLIHLLEYW